MKFFTNQNPEIVKNLAVERVNKFLRDNRNNKILFLTSGGSCMELLDGISEENLNQNITFILLDERFTRDPANNNYQKLLTKKEFIKRIESCGSILLDTSIKDGEGAEDYAERYSNLIKNWQDNNPGGIIFATFGVGSDGHTAGILPLNKDEFNKLFIDSQKYFVAYKVESKDFEYRITATVYFIISQVDFGIVYQVEKNFRSKWEKIISGQTKLHEVPATVFTNLKRIEIYTD